MRHYITLLRPIQEAGIPALRPELALIPLLEEHVIRLAFVMAVYPDKHAEYQTRHNPIWPEMEQTLKGHGVHNYSIFLHESTHQLFAYVEVESEARWNAIAETEVCRRWWASMKELMPSNQDDSPVSAELKPVFHLE